MTVCVTHERARRTTGTPRTEPLVDDVVAGPGGAMTRAGGTLTGALTVTTTALQGGRAAQVTVVRTGAEDAQQLAGSPFPIPPEGIEALHAIVVSAIGAADHPRPAPRVY